jgi:anti-sigma factor RsiW
MNEVHDNDDVLLDRLVDGELSGDERRRLLASLEDRPDGWRRCALAFLEAQSWRGEMRQMVREEATPTATLPLDRDRPRTSSSRAGAWLASAAALLVAFGVGWGASHRWNATNDPAALFAGSTAPVETQRVDPSLGEQRLTPDADAVTLVVQDRSGARQRVQVPLVDGSQLGRQFADAPQWAAGGMRQRLAEQGLDLQARRRYAPLFFEQQDRIVPMIVPVDDAVITPVSRPIY